MARKFAWIIADSLQSALMDLEAAYNVEGYDQTHGSPTMMKIPAFDEKGQPKKNEKGDILLFDRLVILVSQPGSMIIDPNAKHRAPPGVEIKELKTS